ncbi:MAG: DNA-binding protein, YbaB/EbfC family [Candidatus Magasanikbacteria bacterium GW2011_GWC2_37_14]|uniref:Nucleoid-associated protein US42_C0011G0040 n=1 Tax=Candidatus Magasanikbacteria bacterium GW2011_GWC2_37_14 TaxID=1619046 RepID=A0A0G0GBG4_9BACT|nr:MAG: DNA-binding protein, YbaB/EbfC family [Candidatus Magasanikbacteria bacterium GW2011_GWC2_37_14]
MFTKLKQFKDLRTQAKQWQNTMGEESATGEAAFGKVKVTLNGNLEVSNVEIADELLATDKKDKLQTAVKEAHNEALKKIQKIMAVKMKEMGGLPQIPGLS